MHLNLCKRLFVCLQWVRVCVYVWSLKFIYVYVYYIYYSNKDCEISTKKILDLIWQGWRKFEQVQDSLFRIQVYTEIHSPVRETRISRQSQTGSYFAKSEPSWDLPQFLPEKQELTCLGFTINKTDLLSVAATRRSGGRGGRGEECILYSLRSPQ